MAYSDQRASFLLDRMGRGKHGVEEGSVTCCCLTVVSAVDIRAYQGVKFSHLCNLRRE